MVLYIIGIGLCDEKDITLKGLELVKKADKVYLENYTSILCNKKIGKKIYGKKIIIADREMVEQKAEETILKNAKTKKTALLIVGDPFAATTHTDLLLRAKKLGIKTEIVHNASIMSAIGITGLQVYKFGKTTSIPFTEKEYMPETPYNTIKENKQNGMHTLILLDLKNNKFMTAKEGIEYLLKIEEKRKENIITKETKIVVTERIGCKNFKIHYDTIDKLLRTKFGKPLHAIIIPAKMHFMEEEMLENWHH